MRYKRRMAFAAANPEPSLRQCLKKKEFSEGAGRSKARCLLQGASFVHRRKNVSKFTVANFFFSLLSIFSSIADRSSCNELNAVLQGKNTTESL